MPTPAPSADRNLIFGLLALQMDFVTREQLLDAIHAWMLDKHTPLGDILCRRSVLADDERQVLDLALQKHLRRHGGDPKASLASLRVEPAMRQDLDRLDDADVQASVASLAISADSSVDAPVTAAPVAIVAPAGRFRRLREHARGGLGEVFVALDGELNREVALKEIQERFADHPEARGRFLREAEITGNLEHPGVGPVYGLGAYPDGRPYYAMRFIRGESMQDAINRFHEADENPRRDVGERSLALRELLARFVAMCNAVGYAHARGVMHRDLKPANVMLGEYGETLVVDWGLARMLDQPRGEQTTAERPVELGAGSATAPTQMGQVVGTPAYMPPEQAEGRLDRLGMTNDVFSLGATLYALLVGQPPYHGEDVLGQARRAEVVSARRRKASVPAALSAVCGKALAKQPEERYASAKALAEEVQRWLADEPVHAYRERLSDRLRRWGRRHRAMASVGMAVLLAGAVALGVGLWLVNAEKTRTQQALMLAEENLDLAKQAVDECFNVAKDDPLFQGPRMEKARNLLLRKTLPFYRNFRVQRPDDRSLQHEEAAQWFRVGYIEQALLRTNEAREAYEWARKLFGALVQRHPDVPGYQNHLALTHAYLADLLRVLGKQEEALWEYEQARTLLQKLVQRHPDVPVYQQDLARAHRNLGSSLSDLGKREKALGEYQQARTLFLKLVQSHPDLPQYQDGLALTRNNLGHLLSALGKWQEALTEYQEARSLQQKLVQSHPDVPGYQNDLGVTYRNLGNLLSDLRKPEKALN
jgi:serine/threonine-protein kinase